MAEEIVFPNKIRYIRRMQNRTMQQLADHLNLSLSALSKIEKGFRRLNHDQSSQVAEFLNCSVADLYLTQDDEGTPVVDVWKKAVEKRTESNQAGGLKILGAGLRFLRVQKKMTLAGLAAAAKITVSVYHRIEMGQRELYEDELQRLAEALQLTPHSLLQEIYTLNKGGVLANFTDNTRRNKSKPTVAPSVENITSLSQSLFGQKLYQMARQKLVPVYGTPKNDGSIEIVKTEDHLIPAPTNLQNRKDVYATTIDTRRMRSLLPTGSMLFIDPNDRVRTSDLVLIYEEDFDSSDALTATLYSLRDDANGQLYAYAWNPDEQILVDDEVRQRMHRVIFISMNETE